MATFSGGVPATAGAPARAARRRVWLAVAFSTLVAPGCTRIDNALATVPIFAFMREAPSFDPYEHPLPPPPGSVPYASGNGEMLPPMEASDAAFAAFAASALGRNPLAADDPAALELGRIMYERHCSVCHGTTGAADGPVAAAYPQGFVLPLDSGTALGLSDAYVYAIIRAGRGRMPAYGARMTHIERWSVVNYVNSLQGAAGAAAPPNPVPAAGVPTQEGTPAQPAPAPDTTTAPPMPPTQQ